MQIEHLQDHVVNYPQHQEAWDALAERIDRKSPEQLAAVIASAEVNGIAIKRRPIKASKLKEPDYFLKALATSPDDLAVRASIGRYLRDDVATPSALPESIVDPLTRYALPELIRIETASACNLRCQHCTTGVAYADTDRRVMRMETFDRVLAQVNRIPTIRSAILYLGGEPLLNKNHALMCKRVKQETHIKRTKFVTNGMLIDEEWCDKLADAEVDSISISIDGLSPNEHNILRTRSDYETIRKNVWLLKRRLEQKGCKTKIQLGNTQIKRTDDPAQASVPEFLAKEFPGFDIGPGYAMVWPGMEAADTGLEGLTVEHKGPRNFCDHPFFDLAVRANGDIILCCYDISGKHVMGNVMRDDILDVYQSKAYVDLRRAMIRGRASDVPPICQRCSNFTGSTFSRDPHAELKLARGTR